MELANALSAPEHRRIFVDFLNKSRANPNIVIHEAERELFDEGVELYRKRQDKSWSLTDCISFVVMKREGIKEALTGEGHFEQAGFKALLR